MCVQIELDKDYNEGHLDKQVAVKDKRPNEFELRSCSGWSDEDGEIQYGITFAERMVWYGMTMPSNTNFYSKSFFGFKHWYSISISESDEECMG
nr:2815_t:CDS:2 [Entrophospora candida]